MFQPGTSHLKNTVLLFFLLGILGIGTSISPVFGTPGQENKPPQSSSEAKQAEVKIPHTATDHEGLAERYEKKIVEYQNEIETHRVMLAEYQKRVAQTPKQPGENPYLKKMRRHCERYMEAAHRLLREAEKMAEYHRLRAAELRGE